MRANLQRELRLGSADAHSKALDLRMSSGIGILQRLDEPPPRIANLRRPGGRIDSDDEFVAASICRQNMRAERFTKTATCTLGEIARGLCPFGESRKPARK